MKLNRILNKKVLKYVFIISIIVMIAYYLSNTKEGFVPIKRSCTTADGKRGIHQGFNYTDLEVTCKTYGITCPSGFNAGSLNTNDPTKNTLTRCVKDIQMCNDNSDYDKRRNTCKDTNSGVSTPVRSGAVCATTSTDEEIYVSGSFCQIAKKANPSCTIPVSGQRLTFNPILQRCVLPCSANTYGDGKYPPIAYTCINNIYLKG